MGVSPYSNLEVKVGLFVILALLASFITAKYIGYLPQREQYYKLYLLFDNAGGISEGSPVYMSGVKVGEVDQVGIDRRTYKAIVTLKIYKKIRIPKNSTFIAGSSLMGEKYVYIKPKPSNEFFSPGARITENTVSVPDWSELMMAGKNAFQSLDKAGKKLEEVLAQLQIGDDLRKTLVEAQGALREAKLTAKLLQKRISSLSDKLEDLTLTAKEELVRTSDNANSLLIEAKGQIREVGSSISRTSDELYAILSENRSDIRELVSNSKEASKHLNQILSENRDNLRKSIENIRDITDELKEDVKAVSPLLKDKKLQRDIRTIIAKGKEVVETAEFLLAPAKSLKEQSLKYKDFRFAMPQVDISYIENYPHNPVTTVNVDIFPYSKQFFRIGIFDLGHDNLLNLQVGYWEKEMRRRIRMGMIESQLGVGLDTYLSKKLWLTIDLYNPSKITLNTYLIYGNPSKYSIKFGYRNMLRRDKALTIGVFKSF